MLGQTVIQFPVADAKTPADGLARAEAFITQFKGDPLITPAVAPHAIYTLDGPTLKAARELSKQLRRADADPPGRDARRDPDARGSASARRRSPYLDSLGVLGPGVLAAHGVWVTDADIAMLKSRGVGVSHNPESNMKLASGTAPVTGYLRAGVALGLGTDGAASNNDLDMFEAMRTASLLAKLQTVDPSVVRRGHGARDGDDGRRARARARAADRVARAAASVPT